MFELKIKPSAKLRQYCIDAISYLWKHVFWVKNWYLVCYDELQAVVYGKIMIGVWKEKQQTSGFAYLLYRTPCFPVYKE